MALWQRAGISPTLGGSLSWSSSVAFVLMYVVFWVSGIGGLLLVFGLGTVRLAEFLRRLTR
jgi:hypothetical protein